MRVAADSAVTELRRSSTCSSVTAAPRAMSSSTALLPPGAGSICRTSRTVGAFSATSRTVST